MEVEIVAIVEQHNSLTMVNGLIILTVEYMHRIVFILLKHLNGMDLIVHAHNNVNKGYSKGTNTPYF